jgi:predicted nucleic acid-binding protein
LPFSDLEAETYSTIRADLEKQGKMIGGNDLIF